MTPKQASVGDALIFMTKAIVGSIVLIATFAAGVWGYMVWGDGKAEEALRNAAAAHTDAENRMVIFRYQNRYLKEYVASLEHALREAGGELPPPPTELLSDEEVLVVPPCPTENPCKPWERWAPPGPPGERC